MNKSKKDVAILCQYFYPEHVSSATLPTQLAQGLSERGLSVEVFTGYPSEYIDSNKEFSAEIGTVRINRIKYTSFDNKTKLGRLLNFFSFFLSMCRKIFKLKNYKRIIVYSNPPILPLIPYITKKLFKVKFTFVAFDIYPDNALKMKGIKPNGLIHKTMNFVNHRVYSNAENVVLLGSESKEYIIKNKIATKESNLTVIPNWFTGDENIIEATIENNEFKKMREQYKLIILYSGNMGAFQDLDTILEGVKKFKGSTDVLFLFSGHGKKFDEVKKVLREEGIENSKVFGFLKGQDYTDILAVSDVCLVSLEKGIEGLGVPSKTYGYMAAGKSVISIMSGGTDISRDLLEWNCGHNILQGDSKGIVKIINNYLVLPSMLKVEGENAKRLYNEKYCKNISIEKYYKLMIKN